MGDSDVGIPSEVYQPHHGIVYEVKDGHGSGWLEIEPKDPASAPPMAYSGNMMVSVFKYKLDNGFFERVQD